MNIEQQRSNILTRSTNGLDAHRLRTRGTQRLEFGWDTIGFPTVGQDMPDRSQYRAETEPDRRASTEPGRARIGQTRARLG